MSSLPATRNPKKATRKPAAATAPAAPAGEPAPKRTCQCWNAGGGRWVLQLTFWHPRRSAEDQFYHLTALPSDFGAAYELRKLAADGGEVYHANLSGPRSSCECMGFSAHGHCKHVESLLALQGRGKLPTVAPATPAAVTAPTSWDDL